MERDYVPRRASSAAPVRRRPPQRGGRNSRNNRRKNGPPPIFLIALGLLLVVLIVVLVIVFTSGNKGKKEPSGNSASSSASQISGSTGSELSNPASQVSAASTPEPTPPKEKDVSGLEVEKLDSMLRVGDSGYEYYSFVEETANQYTTMVTKAGAELKGSATLYDMVIPTSMDILLPEDFLADVNTSDQKKAINYIYGSINAQNPDVKTVPIFDALKLHNNEYIYFRTDHHWTQLGAYYAYAEFCKSKGIEAVPLTQFEKKEYPGFLGSFYADDNALSANPDTVEAYLPKANATLDYTTGDDDTITDWPVIQDGTDYDKENLYLIFIAGDQPYEEITNKDLNDGSACVVVKESFGNAFVPFLVNHYQHIYVVDYRYYKGNIAALAKEKGATDVIMLNNISMTRNADLVDSISGKF